MEDLVQHVMQQYSKEDVCRAMLKTMATALGSMPEVRRLTEHFGDHRIFPQRPQITLQEANPSVYLLGWREGECTDIHDHADAEVGIYVVQGVITEDLFGTMELDSILHCVQCFSRDLRQGELISCPRPYIHRMSNLHPEIAVTLHVYGPSLDKMRLFDVDGQKLIVKQTWRNEH